MVKHPISRTLGTNGLSWTPIRVILIHLLSNSGIFAIFISFIYSIAKMTCKRSDLVDGFWQNVPFGSVQLQEFFCESKCSTKGWNFYHNWIVFWLQDFCCSEKWFHFTDFTLPKSDFTLPISLYQKVISFYRFHFTEKWFHFTDFTLPKSDFTLPISLYRKGISLYRKVISLYQFHFTDFTLPKSDFISTVHSDPLRCPGGCHCPVFSFQQTPCNGGVAREWDKKKIKIKD